jgi:5-methylcytosine-specific restriction endonuclease McrA
MTPILTTLELNLTYEPVRLISWQESIQKWSMGRVEIIEEYNLPLRSQYVEMKIPPAVKLTESYHKQCSIVPLDRWAVYARDGWSCQYCGRVFRSRELTFDHVFPKSRGGKTSWTNIVTACKLCNCEKDNRTPKEAEMPLLRKPTRPRWLPWLLAKTIRLNQVPAQWVPWISWIPSKGESPEPEGRLRSKKFLPLPA